MNKIIKKAEKKFYELNGQVMPDWEIEMTLKLIEDEIERLNFRITDKELTEIVKEKMNEVWYLLGK